MSTLSAANLRRLDVDRNIWLATVRPDGRPHLTPIWFVWDGAAFYVCTQQNTVKARNLAHNAHAALSLEDGSSVVICEGQAEVFPAPWPAPICARFQTKYDWDIRVDLDYTLLLRIIPDKWLVW